jgi:hemoglobin
MGHKFRSAEQRRCAIVALTQKETGIDEAMIETLVRAFYARVRQDPLLAPIFASRVSDWEPHLDNMFAFWSSLTLQTGRYHGQPMAKHMPLAVDARHFDRWRVVRRHGA